MNDLWKSAHPEKLPDFIIGGAMKSGTTTLHGILNSHPEIYIAHEELGFYDIDNIIQHPDFHFFQESKKQWITQNMEEHREKLWTWYYKQFEGSDNLHKIFGEDSTTYLASETAAKRISMQDKPIKLLFILRHPTERAISNYLHLLKSGRAQYNLEDTLRFQPESILRRSLYKSQIENYFKYIPSHRIKIISFERFLKDKLSHIEDICGFLEVDSKLLDNNILDSHHNKTKIPKSIGLQIQFNRLLQKRNKYRYVNNVPLQPNLEKQLPTYYRLMNKISKELNPQSTSNVFDVSPATRHYIDEFFKIELDGLDDLVAQPLMEQWFK